MLPLLPRFSSRAFRLTRSCRGQIFANKREVHTSGKSLTWLDTVSTEMSGADARERGNAAAKRGEWLDAVGRYSEAIAADPRDQHAWCNRALAYIKLKQPLLAFGDAAHVLEGWSPRNVKAAVRLGDASEAMQLYDYAESAYTLCLGMSLDDAMRRDIQERVAKTKTSRVRREVEAAEEAKSMQLLQLAHKGGAMDAAAQKRMVQMALASGLAKLPRAYRGGAGGPRHPSAIVSAFGGALSTDWIALRDLGGKGVGVVAARDIPARKLVHGDTPLLAASFQSERADGKLCCHHCTRHVVASAAVRCACDRVYCSAACKEVALTLYHSPLCAMAGGQAVARLEAYAAGGSTASSRFILLMWKMLGAALVQSTVTGQPMVPPADCPPLCHLARLTDLPGPDAAAEDKEGLPMSAMYVIKAWSLTRQLLSQVVRMDPALSIRWICDSVGLLSPNVIGLSDSSESSIVSCGQALMGAGSFFNHSCVPNTHHISNTDEAGSNVYFLTNQPVKAGEELTISYCDVDAPLELRQNTLRGQYGFDCDCSKCKAEA